MISIVFNRLFVMFNFQLRFQVKSARSLFILLALTVCPSISVAQTIQLKLPKGFHAQLVATDVGPARHIAVDAKQNIYVRLESPRQGKSIAFLQWNTTKQSYSEPVYFGDIEGGTGIRIFNDQLFVSTTTEVYHYDLKNKNGLVDQKPQLVVSDLPSQFSHTARSLTINAKGELFVNVGAPSNACQKSQRTPGSPGQQPCSQLERHAGVWKFDAGQLHQKFSPNQRYASGTRNLVALAWHHKVNELYAVQHGRDQLDSLFSQIYTAKENANLPAEEFILIKKGFVGGWPYTYWDQNKKARIIAPEYGGDGKKTVDKDKYPRPLLAFPAHLAPNDLLFYQGDLFPQQYKNGAFVAFHGSWNRSPFEQKGYFVAFVPFDGSSPKGDYDAFAEGFTGKTQVRSSGEAAHRPMGLAQSTEGALFIADSVKGYIWKITYKH